MVCLRAAAVGPLTRGSEEEEEEEEEEGGAYGIYEFRKQYFNEVVGVYNNMTSRQDIKEGSQNPHAG